MKKRTVLQQLTCALIMLTVFTSMGQATTEDLQSLKGEWKLDMTPQDKTDANFAMMRITEIDSKSVQGIFYREGVVIKEGRVNTQSDVPYVALISGDNSGSYNSTFYYKNGKLYGSTHAVNRAFLAVWTAEKVK